MDELNAGFAIVVGFVALALLFDFLNGFTDAANFVATMVSTQVLSARSSLIIASVCEFVGAYFLGTAVAKTIAGGMIDVQLVARARDIGVIYAALGAAVSWDLLAWYFKMPSSSTHALVGGLLGAFACTYGIERILWHGVGPILGMLIVTPLIGFVAAYLLMRGVWSVGQWCTPRINRVLRYVQIAASCGMALASGTNDAQKTMGVITLGLVVLGLHPAVGGGAGEIPHWVVASCAGTIGLGIACGGTRIMKTLGMRLYRIRQAHGFATQTAACAIIAGASMFGFPVSTTEVVTSSIVGAGATAGIKRMRWDVFRQVGFTWLVTVPISFAFGYVFGGVSRLVGW